MAANTLSKRPRVGSIVILLILSVVINLYFAKIQIDAINSLSDAFGLDARNSLGYTGLVPYIQIALAIVLLIGAGLLTGYRRVGVIILLVACLVMIIFNTINLVDKDFSGFLVGINVLVCAVTLFYMNQYLRKDTLKPYFH